MSQGDHLIHTAQAWANAHGDGAGYWLRVQLMDGTTWVGACDVPKGGIMRMDPYEAHKGVNHGAPVWIRLEHVMSVQIEW